LTVPEYASLATRKLAEKINTRAAAANVELSAAQAAHDEAVKAHAQAADIMSCDPDAPYQASGLVQQASRALRRAEIGHLRAEIQIRADVARYETAILTEHAAAVAAARKALADITMEIVALLRKSGFAPFLDYAQPQPLIGVFAPIRPDPRDLFIRGNSRVSVLEQKLQEILPVPVVQGANVVVVAAAESRLKELLGVPVPSVAVTEKDSARATEQMKCGLSILGDREMVRGRPVPGRGR
jgi:hypothetical protein